TICNQWAWKPNDKMKSLKECLTILSKTAGGNGNLLLNVGPMPDGRMEARQVKRLREIGAWLKVNGKAIYGTKGGPYEPTNVYATTRKNNIIYVHVLNPDTTAFTLKAIPGIRMVSAHTLTGEKVELVQNSGVIEIHKPQSEKNGLPYVVALEADKPVESIPIIK
ncbi:MAG: alpha-L-fucosidase, partial [Niabella sp.]|nr:alpha-L-fucosidase [Niabella sp.]